MPSYFPLWHACHLRKTFESEFRNQSIRGLVGGEGCADGKPGCLWPRASSRNLASVFVLVSVTVRRRSLKCCIDRSSLYFEMEQRDRDDILRRKTNLSQAGVLIWRDGLRSPRLREVAVKAPNTKKEG